MGLFCYFNFERKCDVLKSKSLRILLNKNINFDKNKTELKIEIAHTVLVRRTLCFSSYKNRKSKKKQKKNVWVRACERKRGQLLYRLFVRRNFFNICILSQCIAYWIHFQNTNAVTHQKTLLHTLLLFVFIIA